MSLHVLTLDVPWRKTDVLARGRSGSLSNATTGEVVADILSFADNGIVSDSGLGFPALNMPIVWRADEHFASMSTSGVR